jgi:nitroreductase
LRWLKAVTGNAGNSGCAKTQAGHGNRPNRATLLSAIDTGFVSQNVYLFCASEGLAAVVRGLIDRKALATLMRLRPLPLAAFAAFRLGELAAPVLAGANE